MTYKSKQLVKTLKKKEVGTHKQKKVIRLALGYEFGEDYVLLESQTCFLLVV